jgi:hypothetical protein
MRRVFFLCGAATLVLGSACAQSLPFSSTTVSNAPSPNESSSSSYQLVAEDGLTGGGAGLPGGAGAGQGQGYGSKHGFFSLSNFAAELGGGFNAPAGNDTPYITWGGNFTGGAGLHINQRISILGEFQFIDDKLPGAFIAAGNNGAGGYGAGGNAHILSLTVDPLIDLFPKATNSVYVTGGGGYYHKSTNFTQTLCCDFYGYPMTFTTNSFSSNQAGMNVGFGLTHRLSGFYGDGTMKLFAEARYVYIHTPPITQPNGLGTTELIPVTLGVRW